jgi:hypothetical protein
MLSHYKTNLYPLIICNPLLADLAHLKNFYLIKNLKINMKTNSLLVLTFLIIFPMILTQTDLQTLNEANLEYDGIFGIGWGIFAIIIAIIVGVLCCLFGLATINPLVFYIIGFVVPILTFIIMIIVPLTQPGNLDEKDSSITNTYIVVKWLFFAVMLVSLCLLCLPMCNLWTLALIPQRVDSRAQRDYHEKFEKMMAEEKQRLARLKEQSDKEQEELNKNLNLPQQDVILPVQGDDGGRNIEMAMMNENQPINEEVEDVPADPGKIEQKRKTLMSLRKKYLQKND